MNRIILHRNYLGGRRLISQMGNPIIKEAQRDSAGNRRNAIEDGGGKTVAPLPAFLLHVVQGVAQHARDHVSGRNQPYGANDLARQHDDQASGIYQTQDYANRGHHHAAQNGIAFAKFLADGGAQ